MQLFSYKIWLAGWLCALIICPSAFSQNLLPNSSFETGSWQQANTGSADWLTASNVFGVQTPHSGTRMMGQAFGNQGGSNFREYIKAPLTTPLTSGTTYYVEMWFSLSDNYGTYACNNQGFAFTTFNPYYGWSTGPIPLTPQVNNLTPITSQTTWTQFGGTFTASAAFTYVTIGNFYNDASTTYQFVGGNSFSYGYYFMDDALVQIATVLPSNFNVFDVNPVNDEYVSLKWTVPVANEGLLFEVQRSEDGVNFENLSTLKASPENLEDGFVYEDKTAPFNEDVYYRILQNDGNGEIHFSDVRQVRLENHLKGNVTGVYPSLTHAADGFTIEYLMRNGDGEIRIELMDATGRMVLDKRHHGVAGSNTFHIQPGHVSPGTYFVAVTSGGKREVSKILITE